MKRTVSLILALALVLALAPGVLADVIVEPEDAFYREYRSHCHSHDRGYFAAGPDGAVTVYKSPKSPVVVTELENGEYVWIGWTYTDSDGNAWGYCEHWNNEDFVRDWTGWMPLDHLLLKYDSISFREEFSDRIEDRGGQVEGQGNFPVVFWEYPGSGEVYASLTAGDGYVPEYEGVFTDDAGRSWGFVGYYMGLRNVWICLDAPGAGYEELYAEHPPQQVTHPVQSGTPAQIKPDGPGMGAVIAAVCAVAVLSGGFLLVTRKKK